MSFLFAFSNFPIKMNIGSSLAASELQDSYNHFHKVFDFFFNFLFTTSETMRDYYLKTWYKELPHELPNNLRLRILGI